MLNIVIPMAGRGSRFQKAGFTLPKPLITVHGKPMISVVIQNIRPREPHRFIFLCLQEHIETYHIDTLLAQWAPGCAVVPVNQVTEGAACTVLLAKHLFGTHDPLMIANSDQWVDQDVNRYLDQMSEKQWDGLIMTMTATDPKWSYVRVDPTGLVREVAEKKVISHEATVGIYNFAAGLDFVQGAEDMIKRNERVNNEFYVAPVYNQLINQGKKIGIFNIGTDSTGMYGLGIPEDLERFVALPVSQRAVSLT